MTEAKQPQASGILKVSNSMILIIVEQILLYCYFTSFIACNVGVKSWALWIHAVARPGLRLASEHLAAHKLTLQADHTVVIL